MNAMVDAPVPDGWQRGYFDYRHAAGLHQMWGWTRGCWGIFERGYETSVGDYALASLTHLPTGYRFALFTEARDAAEASEAMDRVCDWNELPADGADHQLWKDRAALAMETWGGLSFFKTDLIVVADGRGVWARDLNARPDNSLAGRQ